MVLILNNYAERLRQEIDRIGVSELARNTGFARNSLYNWCDKGNIPLDKLYVLAQHGVDLSFVIAESGDFAQNTEQSTIDSEFAHIPVRNVIASAGSGAQNDDEDVLYHFAYRRDWLKSRGLYEKDLDVVVVRGDSMEPTISDNESVLINKAEVDPQDGHIYLLRSGDSLWVKRIQRQFDNSLLLISDNKQYPPMRLDLEATPDVQVIGKVVNSSKNFY